MISPSEQTFKSVAFPEMNSFPKSSASEPFSLGSTALGEAAAFGFEAFVERDSNPDNNASRTSFPAKDRKLYCVIQEFQSGSIRWKNLPNGCTYTGWKMAHPACQKYIFCFCNTHQAIIWDQWRHLELTEPHYSMKGGKIISLTIALWKS